MFQPLTGGSAAGAWLLLRYINLCKGERPCAQKGLLLLLQFFLLGQTAPKSHKECGCKNSSCFVCFNMLFAYSLKKNKEKQRPRQPGSRGTKVESSPTLGVMSSRVRRPAEVNLVMISYSGSLPRATGAQINAGCVKFRSDWDLQGAASPTSDAAQKRCADIEHNHSWHDKLHEWFKPVGDAAVRMDRLLYCCCIHSVLFFFFFSICSKCSEHPSPENTSCHLYSTGSLRVLAEERLPPLRLTVIKYHDWDFWLHLSWHLQRHRRASMCLASAFQVGIVSGNWLNSIYIMAP